MMVANKAKRSHEPKLMADSFAETHRTASALSLTVINLPCSNQSDVLANTLIIRTADFSLKNHVHIQKSNVMRQMRPLVAFLVDRSLATRITANFCYYSSREPMLATLL